MKEIRELLNKYLLRGDMDEIYRKLETEKSTTSVGFEILNEQFRKWKGLGGSNFQIDLPLLISENEKKAGKRIMIIGQDPNNDGKEDNGRVILNTPYSFLAQEGNVYNEILNALKGEYELYLTDLYKMFFWFKSDLKMAKNKKSLNAKSHQLPTYTFEAIHYTMLREEINIVKPDLIVTFGNTARRAVQLIAPNTIKYRDTVTKDKILLQPSYEFLLDSGKRIKYAPLPHPSNSVRQSGWNKFFTENEIEVEKRAEGVLKVILEVIRNLL